MQYNRRMKKYSLFLVVFSLLLFTTSQADEVVPFQYNDDNLLLPIPDGFCNATEDLVGIFIMDYLNTQISNGADVPEPVIVYTRCGFENTLEEIYPFGYIGLINNSKPTITQKVVNKTLDKVLDNSEMMQKLQESIDNATKDTISEYGMEFEAFGIDQSTLVWTDENVAIVTTRMQYIMEGETFNEFSVQASTALNKTLVNYYVMDEESGLTTPKENAFLLIVNSKRLVRMNK